MNTLTRGFSAFRHRNYALYFGGQTISLVGTWMQTIAQAWLVITILHGSAAQLGFVSALQMFPSLLVGTFGGVFADRVRKRDLLVVTQSTQMILAFVLGFLVQTGSVQMWHVYVLATLLGAANAFDAPTRQAFVMEMVGRDDLMNAVALNSMTFNTARIVGPAVAGVLIGLVGVTSSFYLNGISFLFVIGALMMMRTGDFYAVELAPRTSVLRSLAEGFRYVRDTEVALIITSLVGVLGVFAFNTNVLVPLFAARVLNVGAFGYGILTTAMGLGSLVAALIAAFAQRSRWTLMLIGGAGMCASQILFSLSRNFPLSVALMGLTGLSMITFFTSANTGIQRRVPDRLRGRVMGIYMTVNMGTTPFGNLAAGGIAGAFGAPVAMAAGALAGLTGLGAICAWMFRIRGRADLTLEPEDVVAVPAQEPSAMASPHAHDGRLAPATASGRRAG